MKTLEYIKAFMEEKVAAWKQVEENPEVYDQKTIGYAKAIKDDAVKWYEEALKREELKE